LNSEGYWVDGRRFFGRNDLDRRALERILGQRRNGDALNGRHQDIARSAQDACEQAMVALLRRVTKLTGSRRLCLAGGVALNCKANGELLRSGLIDQIYVQPAAGDDGTSIGAALGVYLELGLPLPRNPSGHTYLGPQFSNEEIERVLQVYKLPYRRVDNAAKAGAGLLARNRIVGWFQGRMEFGPRALGARSILGDARNPKMQSVMNLKIKYRESFRPFAPSVLREKVSGYFVMDTDSPYMLLVAPVVESRRTALTKEQESLWGIDLLNVPKSDIPAATHVDYSARVQTVHEDTNPRYYKLIKAFESKTGCALLVNTSFNVRNEPIVCSPEDAYRCFMRSAIDILVLENCVLLKTEQKPTESDTSWQQEFELD